MARKRTPRLRAVTNSDLPSKVDQYLTGAAETAAARFIETFDEIKQRCESPIEELLMAGLYNYSQTGDPAITFMPYGIELPTEAAFDETVFVFQQIPVGPYRVDIAILDASMPFDLASPRIMIVECDGHDFHEKTKEQARRDKQRDRFLQSKGFKVLRFTGSEIWADPDEVADEIVSHLACNDSWRNRQS